jgi:hypothetical protein
MQSIHPGLAADYGIPATLQRGLHIGHYGRLIFNKEYGQRLRI